MNQKDSGSYKALPASLEFIGNKLKKKRNSDNKYYAKFRWNDGWRNLEVSFLESKPIWNSLDAPEFAETNATQGVKLWIEDNKLFKLSPEKWEEKNRDLQENLEGTSKELFPNQSVKPVISVDKTTYIFNNFAAHLITLIEKPENSYIVGFCPWINHAPVIQALGKNQVCIIMLQSESNTNQADLAAVWKPIPQIDPKPIHIWKDRNIFHGKVLVFLDKTMKPKAVWRGSCNFTNSGMHRNHGEEASYIENDAVAQNFFSVFHSLLTTVTADSIAALSISDKSSDE